MPTPLTSILGQAPTTKRTPFGGAPNPLIAPPAPAPAAPLQVAAPPPPTTFAQNKLNQNQARSLAPQPVTPTSPAGQTLSFAPQAATPGAALQTRAAFGATSGPTSDLFGGGAGRIPPSGLGPDGKPVAGGDPAPSPGGSQPQPFPQDPSPPGSPESQTAFQAWQAQFDLQAPFLTYDQWLAAGAPVGDPSDPAAADAIEQARTTTTAPNEQTRPGLFEQFEQAFPGLNVNETTDIADALKGGFQGDFISGLPGRGESEGLSIALNLLTSIAAEQGGRSKEAEGLLRGLLGDSPASLFGDQLAGAGSDLLSSQDDLQDRLTQRTLGDIENQRAGAGRRLQDLGVLGQGPAGLDALTALEGNATRARSDARLDISNDFSERRRQNLGAASQAGTSSANIQNLLKNNPILNLVSLLSGPQNAAQGPIVNLFEQIGGAELGQDIRSDKGSLFDRFAPLLGSAIKAAGTVAAGI